MNFRRAVAIVVVLGLTSSACKVITEGMPVSVSPIDTPTAPPVVTKTPKPTDPVDGTTPVPALGTATPKATKTPPPEQPTGQPTNVPGCPAPWPPSCAPVASVGVVSFWVMCGSTVVPNSKYSSSANAGCQVKLDTTPKDGSRMPTQTKNDPIWSFDMSSPAYWVGWQGGPFNPTIHGAGVKGEFTAHNVIDGVRSNDLVFHFN
jgi:hypothetical protein